MEKYRIFSPKRNKDKPRKNGKKWLTIDRITTFPYYLVLIGLIAIPFLIMILYAFNDASAGVFEIQFSLHHFRKFFEERAFIQTMLESLYLAGISTVITLIIAYPLAYLISVSKIRVRVIMILIVTAPMWINMLLRANALKQIFETFAPNLLGTNFVLIFGIVYMFLPFMVLPIYTVLLKIDKSLYESAADLGANRFKIITKVIIPLSLSGVISGCMMVFLPAATTFVIPKYLGDGKRKMIGDLIESAILMPSDYGYGYGAAIAIVLGLIMMVFIYFAKKVDKYQGVSTNENNE
ncbi:MAG: ABC transporter permease [Acholeplasmataceae bacterium]